MQDICHSQGIWQLLRLRRFLVAEGHSYYFSIDFHFDESITDYISTICRKISLMLIHKFDNIIYNILNLEIFYLPFFFRKICRVPASLAAVGVPCRKTEVSARKSKVNQRWCWLTLKCNGSISWLNSFRQLRKSVNFRHEICRVLVRSRIYHVQPFCFLLIRRAQVHSMHMFHVEKRHRNLIHILSISKIKKKRKIYYQFLQWLKAVSCNCWLEVCSLLELFTGSDKSFKPVIIFAL